MPAPSPRSQKDETYTQELQRWMARQSFWYRLTHSQGSPESRSMFLVVLTILGWTVPVFALGGFGFYVMVQRYTTSGGFSQLVEQEVGEYLNLTMPKVAGASWKSGVVNITGISGEGKPEGFVRSVKIASARIELPFRDLFEEQWGGHSLTIQGLDLELRGGLLDTAEAASLAREHAATADAANAKLRAKGIPTGPYSGKWWINPDGNTFATDRVIARNSTIRWGLNETNGGRLSGTNLEASRQDDFWVLRCTGGEFSQGWLKNALVDELVLEVKANAVVIKKFDFRLKQADGKQGGDAIGQGQGMVQLAAAPVVELHMDIADMEINRIIPAEYQRVFAGKFKGKVAMTGSTVDEDGFTSAFSVQFVPGFGFGVGSAEMFPVLQVLGEAAADIPVRYIEAKQGGLTFTLQGKTLKCTGANLLGANGDRIEGSFTFDSDAHTVKGVFRIGVKPAALAEHPLIKQQFFREETAGLLWLTLPLEGPVGGNTTGMADEMRTLLRKETDNRKDR